MTRASEHGAVRARTLLVVSATLLPAVASVVGLGYVARTHHVFERQEPDAFGFLALAFSPDGSRLLSGGSCGHLNVWRSDPFALRFGLKRPEWSSGPSRAEVHRMIRTFGEKPAWIDLVAWSRDGRLALVIQAYTAMRLLDMTGSVPRTLWEREVPLHERCSSAAFAGPGGPIFFHGRHGTELIDIATGATVGVFPASGPLVLARDGRTLLIATLHAELARLDLTTGVLSTSPIEVNAESSSESISLAGRSRCLVCRYSRIRLHEITTGRTVRTFATEIHFPRAFCDPDGRVAIVVEQGDPCGMGPGFGERVEVVDLAGGTTRPFPCSLLGGERPVIAAFSPDGETVAIGTNAGRIVLLPVARIASG